MADIGLRAVIRTQGATRALKDGTVRPRGFAFDFVEVPVLVHAFRRMVRELGFDVSEMAFTTYLCAKAAGKPFTALPVFLARGLHHGAIVRPAEAGLREPKDLEGQRVGVNRGYTVTTGVWARGILQDEYGVDLTRVTWVPTGDEHVAEYRPPANVRPPLRGGNLAELVAAGKLAAGVGIAADRPGLAPLIPAADDAALRALRERGLYPINHLVVVRNELLERYPELAPGLFRAFTEAKQRYLAQLRNGQIGAPGAADLTCRRVMEITGADPLPYGIGPNLAMIEKLVRYAVSQRILAAPVPASALFPESTLGLTG